jgi:hypothetical protein
METAFPYTGEAPLRAFHLAVKHWEKHTDMLQCNQNIIARISSTGNEFYFIRDGDVPIFFAQKKNENNRSFL